MATAERKFLANLSYRVATRGNLSVQLRKLEDAGYMTIEKSFVDRKSLTRARITTAGKKIFAVYVKAIGDPLGSE